MKNILAKQLISKLLKQADMPLPGASATSARVQSGNLKFVVFNRNKFRQQLIDMPEELKARLIKAVDGYYDAFAIHLQNDAERKAYSGMTRIAVAKDTHVSRDVLSDLEKSRPELVETAKFVDRYNLQLPSESDTLRSKLPTGSEGEVVQKSTGSDWWFTRFGYAYYDLMAKGEPLKVEEKPNSRTREIRDNPLEKEFDFGINGRFKVGQVANGYTFVIEKDDSRFTNANGERNRETTVIFEPGLAIAAQMQAKWFDSPVTMGKSCVMVDDANPENIAVINCGAAEKLKATDPVAYSKIYKIYADENTGAFYVRKQNNFGAGAGKRFYTSEPKYLSEIQVAALANKSKLNKMCIVKPPIEAQFNVEDEHMSFADIKDRFKYIYAFDPETKNRLLNAKPGDREYPYSIPALQAFKQYLNDKVAALGMEGITQAHTALEGYIVFMIAPIFVREKNVAPGKTRGGELTTKHEYVEDPAKPLEVNRAGFGVYSMRISPARMEAADRVTKGGKLILPSFTTQKVFINPDPKANNFEQARLYMEMLITAMGAKIEIDDTGEAYEVPLLPGIQQSRGTELAEELMRRSRGVAPARPEPQKPAQDKPAPENP